MENNNDVKRWKWRFSGETSNTDTATTYDGWWTGGTDTAFYGSTGTDATTYDGWRNAYGTRWTPDGRYATANGWDE